MDKESLHVISIGYAKNALKPSTRERARMASYASVLSEHHIIVFTKKAEGFPDVQQEGKLFLYATNTKTKIGMLWSAYKIGINIIKKRHGKPSWIVSSQDPMETSLVGRAVSRRARVPHQVQLHGDFFNPENYKFNIFQRLRAFYGRYVVRHSSCIRVVSERLKQSLVSIGVDESVVTVLPIQADMGAFLQAGAKRTYTQKSQLSFLYVGRFSPEKNLSLLLDAFSVVVGEYPDTSLTLLGAGPLQSVLESQVLSLSLQKNVQIKPWSQDVSKVMLEHDILCLSSNHEGWGMVLLEAAASGMPVVTTDVGCAGEIIRYGENGRVVPVGDVTQYVSALRSYLQQPALVSEHGRRGQQIARECSLTEKQYLHALVEAYTSCQ